MPERPHLFGIPLDPLTLDETVARLAALVEHGGFAQHVVLNAGKAVMLQDLPDLREIVAGCEVTSADGMGVVWAARLLGIAVPERVTGIDVMARLLAEAEQRSWPVFLLGARPPVLADCEAGIRARHPRLVVAGRHHGYFADASAVAGEIAESGARVLFVGISSPLKERFVAGQRARLGPLLAVGVGGSFEVWAGRARRAPRFLQRAGLEWLFRLVQEPRRLWRRYLVGNLRFAALVLREWRHRLE